MSLDDTAKQANVLDSIKKYWVDSLETAEGVTVTFDKYLFAPTVQGRSVDRWVSVNFGDLDMNYLSSFDLAIYCCTRADSEGFKLAQLRDKVFKYLTDNTQTDGMARIPFYRSRAAGAWTLLAGGFVVQNVIESRHIDADDGTKFKILNVRCRFASKV